MSPPPPRGQCSVLRTKGSTPCKPLICCSGFLSTLGFEGLLGYHRLHPSRGSKTKIHLNAYLYKAVSDSVVAFGSLSPRLAALSGLTGRGYCELRCQGRLVTLEDLPFSNEKGNGGLWGRECETGTGKRREK